MGRHGTKRAPIFVHGGIAHGPKPRSYDYSLPKKVRALGLAHALSARFQQGRLIFVNSLGSDAFSSKPVGAVCLFCLPHAVFRFFLVCSSPLFIYIFAETVNTLKTKDMQATLRAWGWTAKCDVVLPETLSTPSTLPSATTPVAAEAPVSVPGMSSIAYASRSFVFFLSFADNLILPNIIEAGKTTLNSVLLIDAPAFDVSFVSATSPRYSSFPVTHAA